MLSSGSSSCSTSANRRASRVNLVKNPVTSHLRGQVGFVAATNEHVHDHLWHTYSVNDFNLTRMCGIVASLLETNLYGGNPHRNHKFWK